LFDPDAHGASAVTYGIDLKSAALIWLAQSLCILGYPDRALATMLENLRHCRKVGYAFNLTLTMSWVCYLRLQRREYQACAEQAEELLAMAKDHGLADFIVAAEAHRTLSRCVLDGGEAPLSDGKACIGALRAKWDTFLIPFNLGLLATAQIAAARPELALTTINDALELTDRTEERWSEAELHRLMGEIHLAQGDHGDAESCFLRAIEVARGQNAKLWELRAATALARLWRDRGERQASHDLLAPIYAWFTEGFETLDFLEAKALIEDLS
jgi:tetratricopeptide (TPR) repeat protein